MARDKSAARKAGSGRRSAATISDVARAAGVSTMTVSRVINGVGNVRARTLAAVDAAIAKLSYAPNPAARSLAGARQIRIGLLYSNPSAAYLSEFLVGSLEQASLSHVQLVVEKCVAGSDEARVARGLVSAGVDGIILPPPICDSKPVIDVLTASKTPCVVVASGRPADNVSAVSINDFEAARAMTQHLLELGHARIGFIIGSPNQTASARRLDGYKAALADAGVKVDSDLITQGLFTYRSGLDAAERLLQLSNPPSAIFASNDDMAAAAVAVAHSHGLAVPSDLTVCGYDDTALATTIWPELTTVRQPIGDMSRAAVELLVRQVKAHRAGAPEASGHLVLGFTLVRRQSDAAPRKRPPVVESRPMSSADRPRVPVAPFRSRDWFADPARSDMTALYLERFMNYGITPEELRSGRPIIGIAQSGSDLSPCNRIHLELAQRVREGIRDAGGIPMEFPVHPIFENCRRPTAALDRNLAYLGLVEILYGYPIDAVVLTTGCDKTTPSQVMAASTVDIPAIVLSGGPMLDGWHDGELVGSGTVIWRSRRKLAAGEIDEEEFLARACSSAPSAGHCNSMGTASTMNAVAEALGLSLPGCAAIPAPYRERGQIAYETGKRIVDMAYEDLRPSRILSRESFLNAIAVVSACGGSSNAQPHVSAMARHAGIELDVQAWTRHGYDLPLLVNMQPAGKYLGERFHRAGGVPAVMWELLQAGRLHGECLSVTGKSIAENVEGRESGDREMITPFSAPLREKAGFLILRGNLFDFGLMKTSVISEEFRKRYLSRPDAPGAFEARAIVFDGSDDYHARINDPALAIDEQCILVIRGAGAIGWPGSAEVVNMQPPDTLIRRGIMWLPTLGDGRQSGTSDSPSILNASPESAVGGGLAWLRTGDRIRIDLNAGRCDALVEAAEIARRKKEPPPPVPQSNTPWEELFRAHTSQLSEGATLEFALKYRGVARKTPRHNH